VTERIAAYSNSSSLGRGRACGNAGRGDSVLVRDLDLRPLRLALPQPHPYWWLRTEGRTEPWWMAGRGGGACLQYCRRSRLARRFAKHRERLNRDSPPRRSAPSRAALPWLAGPLAPVGLRRRECETHLAGCGPASLVVSTRIAQLWAATRQAGLKSGSSRNSRARGAVPGVAHTTPFPSSSAPQVVRSQLSS